MEEGYRTFGRAVSICLRDYAGFGGRAPRSEYWFFTLFTVIAGLVASAVDLILFGGRHEIFDTIVSLALLVPSLAVSVRRLHDLDRSGWWLLLALLPIVGWLILLIWDCTRGSAGANRFGPDPLAEPGVWGPAAAA